MLGCICSGCVLEYNTTSPGAQGVVLDSHTRAPLSGADVVVSQLWGIEPPTVSDALTNTRSPVVRTGKNGRFSVSAEGHWDVVGPLVERFRAPGGTLVVQRAGYDPAAIPLWGDIMPISAQRTNFIEVLLNPVRKLNPGDCLLFQIDPFSPESGIRRVVDSAGDVVLPDVGKVHVAGMTLEQVPQAIMERYLPRGVGRPIKVSRCPQ